MRVTSRIINSIFYLIIAILIYFHIRYNWLYGMDDSYITYRYAQNLRLGIGLVFNEGERYFGSTAMGMAIVLAVLSWIVDSISILWFGDLPWSPGNQIPLIAHWISTISVGTIAILAYWIALRHIGSFWAILISVLFAIQLFSAEYMNAASGHETYLFLAFLSLSGYVLIYKERAFWAGVLLGITTTFRPDTLLYAVILACWLTLIWVHAGFAHKERQRLFMFLIGYTFIIIPWFVFCGVYFGQIFPGTLTAKRAQPLLGHWQNFTIKTASGELVRRIRLPMFMAMVVLLAGALAVRVISERAQVWWNLLTNRLTVFISCLMAFGLGQVIFYSLIDVSFWFWYVFPLCIILAISSFLATVDLVQGFWINKITPVFTARIIVLVTAGFLVALNMNNLRYDLNQLFTSYNVNLHIASYDPIINYLKTHAPEGTSVATAEPGALGFKLGPHYRVIDELGLTSPGVAENIIKGNLDFPFIAYSPIYVIVSWPGKYSPHDRSWFAESYDLVGEFAHPFWELNLKRGVYLYRRKGFTLPD
jgi:hypothetical protein